MATNIPPHNLTEVVDATSLLIENPDAGTADLLEVIHGPDFPTGGIIYGKSGIWNAFETGRGSIRIRAKADIEKGETKDRIIVTEIPYQVNKARLIESIADLVKDKRIEGISDLRDESDRDGMRIVIVLKRNVMPEVVLNQLFKHTQMETSFGVINLSLVNGEPKVLSLKKTIQEYIGHRKEVVTRRIQFELKKAEKRAHILEGLQIALEHIDAVIKLIRGSKTVDVARTGLMDKFGLSEAQAQAILEMRLQKLTGLEREKIDTELAELKERIDYYKKVLADVALIMGIIKDELADIKEKYGDERRTRIEEAELDFDIEDLIPVEDVVVTITRQGYIKRLPLNIYRAQSRGGKGIIGMETKEEDSVRDIFIPSSHDYMLFFTNRGRVHWLKVYRIPEAGRYSRGKAIVNLLDIQEGERITASFAIGEFTEGHYLVMATRYGKIKKTDLKAYSRPRKGGIIALTLVEGDELIKVELTDGRRDILLATRNGKAIKFSEDDARPMGRSAQGTRGIRLKGDDVVVGMEVVDDDATLLAVTENGFGKRTRFDDYPIQRRGGQGVINIQTTKRNGTVIGLLVVTDEDEIIMTSAKGVIIRSPVKGISTIGRNTQGVTLMRPKEGDKVVGLAKVMVENGDLEE
jgi:DNA gyrase subunit A